MIIDCGNGIYKDNSVIGDYKTYLGNGQGCGTIWFRNVSAARKALEQDGIKTGRDLVDCSRCSCHYSSHSKEHKKYSEFACNMIKHKYAKSFE